MKVGKIYFHFILPFKLEKMNCIPTEIEECRLALEEAEYDANYIASNYEEQEYNSMKKLNDLLCEITLSYNTRVEAIQRHQLLVSVMQENLAVYQARVNAARVKLTKAEDTCKLQLAIQRLRPSPLRTFRCKSLK